MVRIMLFFIALVLTPFYAQQDHLNVRLELVADGLSAPVALIVPPDETHRRFIVDQIGMIKILLPDGELLEEPFFDVRDQVMQFRTSRNDPRGLLSLAFHPQFADNGRFFVFYTLPAGQGFSHRDVLAEYQVSADDPNRADMESGRILLEIDQKTMEHAAGQLLFGPEDGYLYISLGDDFSPDTTSQNLESVMGSILRIDVDSEQQPYGIPEDNPFVDQPGLDEIYAYGFRHPWRMSFDQEKGTLYVGDPAWQFRSQRVYAVTPGANYGWELQTDHTCYEEGQVLESCVTGPKGETFALPIIEYGESIGRIVMGGYIYHGSAFPEFQGRYIFGEWGLNNLNSPALMIATPTEEGLWTIEKLTTDLPWTDERRYIWGFGQDDEGELYVMTMSNYVLNPTVQKGHVYKIVPVE